MGPFTEREPHPPERPIFPRKRTDVLSRGVDVRGPSTGHAARCLAGPRSWMRSNTHSYPALLPRPLDYRVLGELTLSHHATTGAAAYIVDPAATNGAFHLYDGSIVSPCRTSPSCSRSTWCAVTDPLRLQDTTLSTSCRSRTFFRGRSTSLVQGDRCFPYQVS